MEEAQEEFMDTPEIFLTTSPINILLNAVTIDIDVSVFGKENIELSLLELLGPVRTACAWNDFYLSKLVETVEVKLDELLDITKYDFEYDDDPLKSVFCSDGGLRLTLRMFLEDVTRSRDVFRLRVKSCNEHSAELRTVATSSERSDGKRKRGRSPASDSYVIDASADANAGASSPPAKRKCAEAPAADAVSKAVSSAESGTFNPPVATYNKKQRMGPAQCISKKDNRSKACNEWIWNSDDLCHHLEKHEQAIWAITKIRCLGCTTKKEIFHDYDSFEEHLEGVHE